MTEMSPIEKLAAFYPEVAELVVERDALADEVRRRVAEQARVYRELDHLQGENQRRRARVAELADEYDRGDTAVHHHVAARIRGALANAPHDGEA